MKATNNLPDQTYLRECFDYDPDSGILRWRYRPPYHFPPSGKKTSQHLQRIWNAKWPGKIAGRRSPVGYVWISIGAVNSSAHRIIWKMHHGTEPKQIDHRDRTPANSRIGNLRDASHAQNCQNAGPKPNNQSGLKGVSFSPEKGRYRARLHSTGKNYWLGYHDTAEAAHAAYCKAAREHFGEFFNPG